MAIHTLQPVAFREGWSPIEGEHYTHYFVGILSVCGRWYLEQEAFTQELSAVTPAKAITCPRCERLLAARYPAPEPVGVVMGPSEQQCVTIQRMMKAVWDAAPTLAPVSATVPAPSAAAATDTDVRTLVLDYVRHLSLSDRAALLAEFDGMAAPALPADQVVPFFLHSEAGRNALIRFLSHRRTHCLEDEARQQFTAAIAMVRAWSAMAAAAALPSQVS